MTAILDGILNEIASVALLPRNDGDLMRSSGQARGWHKAVGDDKKRKLGDDTKLRNFRIFVIARL